MSVALKNTVRLSVLALAVAGFSGCGAENPMGPTAAAVAPAYEMSASVAPIDEVPAPGSPSVTPGLIENPGGSTTIGSKKLWSERPGRRVGRGRNK